MHTIYCDNCGAETSDQEAKGWEIISGTIIDGRYPWKPDLAYCSVECAVEHMEAPQDWSRWNAPIIVRAAPELPRLIERVN